MNRELAWIILIFAALVNMLLVFSNKMEEMRAAPQPAESVVQVGQTYELAEKPVKIGDTIFAFVRIDGSDKIKVVIFKREPAPRAQAVATEENGEVIVFSPR